MKVLVTGAAGFIGTHLVFALHQLGHQVVGLDNLNAFSDGKLKYKRLLYQGLESSLLSYGTELTSTKLPRYRFIQMDINDKVALLQLFQKESFDVVCNLAAQAGVRASIEHPEVYIDANLVGFNQLLECCRKYPVKHLVYASSSSVYGANKKTPYAESDKTDQPMSLYAATKKANELMAYAYSSLFQIPSTGLRFFTVYGPWGRTNMAPFLFMKAIYEDEPIQVFNHGNLSRDFTYIDDIIAGILRVIDNPPTLNSPNERHEPPTQEIEQEKTVVKNSVQVNDKECKNKRTPDCSSRESMQEQSSTSSWGSLSSSAAPQVLHRVFNIGHSHPVPLMDFISTLEEVMGKTAQKIYQPMQAGDVHTTYADTTALKNELGYAPSTSLKKGIEAFYNWFITYYENN